MFYDRYEAGRRLAEGLKKYEKEAVVVAIPRGGVLVGKEIAERLGCPLDLVIVRKVGHPFNPEYALCAVSETGEICNEIEAEEVDRKWLAEAKKEARDEAERRRKLYLGERKRQKMAGKTVILTDDGIATGMTYLMAVEEIRKMRPKRIVAALPVMPSEFEERLRKAVDEIVCLSIDKNYLGAVGAYYSNFPQVTDEEVMGMMK